MDVRVVLRNGEVIEGELVEGWALHRGGYHVTIRRSDTGRLQHGTTLEPIRPLSASSSASPVHDTA